MVETVKHAIVLLQIAKNASCPGTQAGSTDDIARVHGAEKVVSLEPSNPSTMLPQVDTVEEARENVDSDSRSSTLSTPTTTPASVSPRISPAPVQRLAVVKPASHKNSNTIPGSNLPLRPFNLCSPLFPFQLCPTPAPMMMRMISLMPMMTSPRKPVQMLVLLPTGNVCLSLLFT